jgi:protein MpaA
MVQDQVPLYIDDPRGAVAVRDIVQTQQQFRSLLQEHFTEHRLGLVSNTGFQAPLFGYSSERNPENPWVFLVAGVHGDEPAGVLGLKDFLEQGDWSWLEHWNVLVIPVANPWGWVYNRRSNGQGLDLNRDFSGKNTQSPEAKLILEWLGTRKPDLVLDLHESISQAYYFYVYNSEGRALVEDFHHDLPFPLDSGHRVSGFETKDGIMEIPGYIPFFLWMGDRLPLASLFLDQTRHVFVVESSRQRPISERRAYHRRALEFFLSQEF